VSGRGTAPNTFQISTSTLTAAQVKDVRLQLQSRYGVGREYSVQSVGPSFGRTIAKSAVIAIIASLLVISVYIALRFEWKYAVPVLIALMHDLLITAGVYSLTGREVTASTVAALLTILGYSLYDTIIVFDRIRENVPRMPRAAFSQIVNRSMNEVLTRSLATSFCTALPILSLLLFGGDTLKDFAFALLVARSPARTRRCSSPRRCSRTGRSASRSTPTAPPGSAASSATCPPTPRRSAARRWTWRPRRTPSSAGA